MSKELPPQRADRNLMSWIRDVRLPDLTKLPITTILIGVIKSEGGYSPIEIDLTKRQPKTIFIVGDPDSQKEELMLGMLRRASITIAPGYLNLDIIGPPDSPYLLADQYVSEHFKGTSFSTIEKMAEQVEPNKAFPVLFSTNPHLFLIDNLGSYLRTLKGKKDKAARIKDLNTIFGHKTRVPLLTVATINFEDVGSLGANGINLETNNIIWIVGKSAGDKKLASIEPGTFLFWSKKDNKFGTQVFPFAA